MNIKYEIIQLTTEGGFRVHDITASYEFARGILKDARKNFPYNRFMIVKTETKITHLAD